MEWEKKYQMSHHQKFAVFFPLTMGHEFLIQENLLFYSLHISPFTICKTNYILHIHTQIHCCKHHTAPKKTLNVFHKKRHAYCTWWKNEIKKEGTSKKNNWRKMEDIPKRNLYLFPFLDVVVVAVCISWSYYQRASNMDEHLMSKWNSNILASFYSAVLISKTLRVDNVICGFLSCCCSRVCNIEKYSLAPKVSLLFSYH